MANTKILYISQVIHPYLPANPISILSRDLPQGIQEKGYEVRMFMPKYGKINERRNQLHEVIRLSGMNIIIDDTDHPLIIKVATMQPSRMQVYFIDNDDYFVRSGAQALETETSPEDNDERVIFFARGVIETVRKLRWEPAIVHCQGWTSTLAPLYIKTIFSDDPSFRSSKVVFSLLNASLPQPMDPRMVEKLHMDGFTDEHLAALKDGHDQVDNMALNKIAIDYADGIIEAQPIDNPELIEYVKASGKPFLPYSEDTNKVDSYNEFYKSL